MGIFRERMRQLREEKALTQQGLAEALNIGKSAIALYETEKRQPDPETLHKLADFFNCSTDYLLGRSGIRETPEQRIEYVISDEPDLLEFWQELKQREDLQLLFKQVKPLSEESIKRIIRYIKMVEDEESRRD